MSSEFPYENTIVANSVHQQLISLVPSSKKGISRKSSVVDSPARIREPEKGYDIKMDLVKKSELQYKRPASDVKRDLAGEGTEREWISFKINTDQIKVLGARNGCRYRVAFLVLPLVGHSDLNDICPKTIYLDAVSVMETVYEQNLAWDNITRVYVPKDAIGSSDTTSDNADPPEIYLKLAEDRSGDDSINNPDLYVPITSSYQPGFTWDEFHDLVHDCTIGLPVKTKGKTSQEYIHAQTCRNTLVKARDEDVTAQVATPDEPDVRDRRNRIQRDEQWPARLDLRSSDIDDGESRWDQLPPKLIEGLDESPEYIVESLCTGGGYAPTLFDVLERQSDLDRARRECIETLVEIINKTSQLASNDDEIDMAFGCGT